MSKGQAQIFTEFLGFAIGLAVMMSIAFIFSNYFAPTLINEALEHHMDNMVKQVETASSQLLYYSDYFGNKKLTLKLNLPTKIAKNAYTINSLDEKLCVTIASTQSFKCFPNIYGIQGSFVSGTRLLITLDRTLKTPEISISAD
ncbi:MAG: hypothetical protein GON13_00040 [Nanoarchaeota archaeon]|nr:hypothetical protein [Nanoarchaeota archaeon]